jgi:hypothetical protein
MRNLAGQRPVIRTVAAFAGLAFVVSGCATDLAVHRLNEPTEDPATRRGVGYVLPFTQYKATITWRVAECRAATDEARGAIIIHTKVEIADGQADDMDHAYLVDPTQLETLFSISSFRVTMQDGRNQLATINAASEDRTAQVIGMTAAGIGKLALALAAPGGLAPEACNQTTRENLEKSKTQRAELVVLNNNVKAAQDALKAAADKVATMGSAVSQGAKDDLDKAIGDLTTVLRVQAAKADELAETLKTISRTEVVYWPEKGDMFSSVVAHELNGATLDRWASVDEAGRAELIRQTQVHFAIERIGSFGRDPSNLAPQQRETQEGKSSEGGTQPETAGGEDEGQEAETVLNGLPYRMPAMGRVFACSASPCNANSPTIYASLQGPVAQLGYVNILPVRTRRFGSTTFAAELTPLGALRSAGYEQRAAPAEGVASAFSSIVNAATPLIDYEAGTEARARAAELAELAYLKARRDALIALEDNPNGDAALTAQTLSADTALLNARIANLNSQILLAETQRRLTSLNTGS